MGVKWIYIFLVNILGARLQLSTDTSNLTWWRCAGGLDSWVVLLPLLKLRVIVVSTHSCWTFVLVILVIIDLNVFLMLLILMQNSM